MAPLLTGERAHYELAAGRREAAEGLLHAMEGFANNGGMIPEQIWDSADIQERELFFGKPAGSAMPLVWAHAEYVKLRRSLRDGRLFDMPPQTVKRYLVEQAGSPYALWRFNQKCRRLQVGKTLRIELLAPALIHWSSDRWGQISDIKTRDTEIGIHVADLPTQRLPTGATVVFTFYWQKSNRWEGVDYTVRFE